MALPVFIALQRAAITLLLTGLLAGCATPEVMVPDDLQPGRLQPPDTHLNIAGLGPCTDSLDRTLRFDASQPLHVLVHGCFGSSGQFRALAQVLAFHGQQAACFTYDDRAKLNDSATELRQALKQLVDGSRLPQLTVIGHSQGALIARKSLTASLAGPLPERAVDLRLVTVSGPFAGIESARTCGKVWLYPVSLGLLPLSCYAVTGPKWTDITYSSRFIREPGQLAPQVGNYLKIDTDERGSCRREEAGRCVESDDIFSLDEQRHPVVEADARTKRVLVPAGHVEIVGDKRVAPTKLIEVLQAEGVLRLTSPTQASAFERLLARLY
ncbi:MAG: alpha/beta hydrolase [Rhizobacter sp.]|nr:alpha/beta hydrolase [Rhizobacter sp.]